MGGQLQCLLLTSLFLVAIGQSLPSAAPNFHFSCNTGYNEQVTARCN